MFVDLSGQPASELVGAKASRLGWLMGRGLPVPPGFVAPFEVTDRLLGPTPDLADLRAQLTSRIDPRGRYVVRSSANVEDQGRRSFAGQFASITGVRGVEAILEALSTVAGSGRAAHVRQYAQSAGVDPDSVRVAVIVQEMVAPVASGVAFSRDPVSGAEHVVIEAVSGEADQLLARGATPQLWIGAAGRLSRQPDDPILPEATAVEIVAMVEGISRTSREPVDVEWVWDGTGLHVVQLRPISGAEGAPRVWSSRMARDVLPGLIPPLVWSINVPVLSRVWADLISEALGEVGLDAGELVRAFGYRAYFNSSALGEVFTSLGMPSDALDVMRDGTSRAAVRPPVSILVRRTPRLARFAITLARWERRIRADRLSIDAERASLADVDPHSLSDAGLLARVGDLSGLLTRAGRLNVVTPLLADAWAASVRRAAEARGVDPGMVDPGQELPEVRAFDPAHALAELDPMDDVAWSGFLERFGHLSESPNDASVPTWAEGGSAVRGLAGPAAGRLDGRAASAGAANARARLLAATARWDRARTARRWGRAARYRLAREQVGYSYARVYALFRPTLLEAGRRLVEREVLAAAADVFLLDLAEVGEALRGALPGARTLVGARRAEMAEAADLHWPETIIGDEPVPIRGRARARVLTGVPTSRGRHTGPARIVVTLAEAGQVGPEDVLVLPAADVTWTPLLLRAGAVVTETGGMLSHASIVARELGLACVASVEGATRIPNGAQVCVDGSAGEVVVLDGDPPAGEPDAGATSSRSSGSGVAP